MSKSTTIFKLGKTTIGDGHFAVIAGPCSIESEDQLLKTAQFVKEHGACGLRGGVYKLRTKPGTFQGLGNEAYNYVKTAKKETGLPFVAEITDPRQINELYEVCDMFQVGARNMHNYALLKELGKIDKPVLLKRGFAGLISEWLYAAEYIRIEGNNNVALCERGIRTFESAYRNTFDINAIAYVKQNSDIPIIADTSHGTGHCDLVKPIAMAALAAGADGLIVEVHPNPEVAKSDKDQALTFDMFKSLMDGLNQVAGGMGKKITTLNNDNNSRSFQPEITL